MTQFSRIYKDYQHILTSAVLIIFCIIGVVAGVIPAVHTIIDQIGVSRDLAQELDTLQQKIDVLDSLDENVLRQNLQTVLSAVPGDKSLPSVFGTVEGVAAQAGVEITDMNIAGVGSVATQSGTQTALEKQLGTRVLPFAVTIQGSFSAIQQFIFLTPSVRRLLRLRTFSMTFPKQAEVLRVSLQMDAFYEPFPTTLGKLGTVITPLSEKEQLLVDRISQFALINNEATTALPQPALGEGKANPFSP